MCENITVLEFTEPQPVEIYVEEFVNHALKYVEENSLGMWYAGITSNITERITQHQSEKKIICKYVKCFLCPSEEFARYVETALGNEGFSTGVKPLKAAVKAAKMESVSFSGKKEKNKVYIYYTDKEPVIR